MQQNRIYRWRFSIQPLDFQAESIDMDSENFFKELEGKLL